MELVRCDMCNKEMSRYDDRYRIIADKVERNATKSFRMCDIDICLECADRLSGMLSNNDIKESIKKNIKKRVDNIETDSKSS